MAKVKTSALFSDISGTIDGATYSRNHFGLYTKGYFSNPDIGSPKQLTQRAGFKSISQHWKTLTEPERLSWILETQNHHKQNSFAESFVQDPFHFFLSCNLNRLSIGLPILHTASDKTQVGELHSFSIDVSDPDYVFWILNFTGQSSDLKTAYLVYATPGISQGIYYVKSKYRYIGYIPLNNADSFDLGTYYSAIFPQPASGLKIFVMLRPVNIDSGIDGNILRNFAIIP